MLSHAPFKKGREAHENLDVASLNGEKSQFTFSYENQARGKQFPTIYI